MARLSRLTSDLQAGVTGLVLFDALHGYLHPNDRAKQEFLAERNVLANLQRLLAGARKAGIATFYPCGAHAPDGSDTVDRLTDTDMDLATGGGAGQPIRPRFSKGSRQAEIAAELAPAKGDVVVPKHRWSAFYQTDLEFNLKVRGIGTIVIAGGSTDVGIASTVFAARDMDDGGVVGSDACFSMRGDNNQFFMERVFPRMARVMTVDQVIALMRV